MLSDGIPQISQKERFILENLIDEGSTYGLDLVSRSKGELTRGTVYTTLSRMADKEFVTSNLRDLIGKERGPRRRMYDVTEHGRRVIHALKLASSHLKGTDKQSYGPFQKIPTEMDLVVLADDIKNGRVRNPEDYGWVLKKEFRKPKTKTQHRCPTCGKKCPK